VIDALTNLFITRGFLAFIRSDIGPEFVVQAEWEGIADVGTKTAYIDPGSAWENGYFERFNGRFRYELLNAEVFYRLRKTQIIIIEFRKHFSTKWPNSVLDYRHHHNPGSLANPALIINTDQSDEDAQAFKINWTDSQKVCAKQFLNLDYYNKSISSNIHAHYLSFTQDTRENTILITFYMLAFFISLTSISQKNNGRSLLNYVTWHDGKNPW